MQRLKQNNKLIIQSKVPIKRVDTMDMCRKLSDLGSYVDSRSSQWQMSVGSDLRSDLRSEVSYKQIQSLI